MNSQRGRFVCSALFLSLSAPLWACSPQGPETVLNQPDWSLRPPIPIFQSEIRQIHPPSAPPLSAKPQADPAFTFPGAGDDSALGDAEYAELIEILRNLPAEKINAARDSYSNRKLPDHHLSEDLPLDMRRYIEGARLFDQGKNSEAIQAWRRLLDLPPEERRNRSTWAAWMIARTLRQDGNPVAAQAWYALCSRLAGEGYRDCLKLGLSSLGWQARYALDKKDYRTALELYYHQALAGDPTAWNSIDRALPPLDELDGNQLRELASDSFLRSVITAGLLSSSFDFRAPTPPDPAGAQDSIQRWFDALESANVESISEASRFAELAYSSANFALAEQWLKKADANDPRALWLRGKIDIMYGRNADAEKHFHQAAQARPRSLGTGEGIYLERSFSYRPASELDEYRISQLYGDLAVAALSQNHYAPALTALYQGNFRSDAAYVSERVLHSNELLAYTKSQFPKQPDEVKTLSDELAESARYLLARRLAREERYTEARAFYPVSLRPIMDRYAKLRQEGNRFNILKDTRSSALWEAAQIHRTLGMELFGTEGEPDDFSSGGTWHAPSFLTPRLGLSFSTLPVDDWRKWKPLKFSPKPTSDEYARALASRLTHEESFHYRYAAADLAWQASQYMPNNSEETARVLGIAGSWLQNRDPKAADRFYKAMIWRNWSTPLAREADAKRWFPEIPWDYDPYAAW